VILSYPEAPSFRLRGNDVPQGRGLCDADGLGKPPASDTPSDPPASAGASSTLPPPHHYSPSSRLSRLQHTPYTLYPLLANMLGRLRLSLAGEGCRAPLYPKEAKWPPIAERRRCLCAKLPRRRAFLPSPSFLSAANTAAAILRPPGRPFDPGGALAGPVAASHATPPVPLFISPPFRRLFQSLLFQLN